MPGHTTYNLNIPANVEKKIRHLCARVHNVEWSGILFYKVDGSFEINDLTATCLDICVMDIGSAGYTKFKDNADIISYRAKHPELLEPGVYEGLIHSHNTMATFFSDTDTDTLGKEGDDVNHFLSLIVNNTGEYTARITRKLRKKVRTETYIKTQESASYNTYENKEVVLYNDKVTETNKVTDCDDEVVEWFNLNIVKAEVEYFRELNERLDFIEKSKKKSYIPTTWNHTKDYSKNTNYDFKSFGNSKKEETYPTFSKNDYQGTLFGDEYNYDPYWEFRRKDSEVNNYTKETKSKEENVEDGLTLADFEQVPERIALSLACQLVSGNIMLKKSEMTTANLTKWLNNLDETYADRFGCLDFKDTISQIKFWIGAFVETLIMYNVDAEYEAEIMNKYDFNPNTGMSTEMPALYANGLLSLFEELLYNEGVVSNLIMEELTNYLM